MDKRIIQAVAGSGKTTYIIDQLSPDRSALIITYTIENYKNLEREIVKKFGHTPPNILLMTYFSFLYSFCFRPFVGYDLRIRGLDYESQASKWVKQTRLGYYVTKGSRLRSYRAGKFLLAKGVEEKIRARLESYFDDFFVDEIQDFAANDFNLLLELVKANINIILVGDFYQHTFDTSRDGQTRKNLHKDFDSYFSNFTGVGFSFDCETLTKSYRCSPTVCQFVSQKLGIQIESHSTQNSVVRFIFEQEEFDKLFKNDGVVKLFQQGKTKYTCNGNNWGKSKGNSYRDVCVVLTKDAFGFLKHNNPAELKPTTKNKLYVACTRTSGDLYFVSPELLKKHKQ